MNKCIYHYNISSLLPLLPLLSIVVKRILQSLIKLYKLFIRSAVIRAWVQIPLSGKCKISRKKLKFVSKFNQIELNSIKSSWIGFTSICRANIEILRSALKNTRSLTILRLEIYNRKLIKIDCFYKEKD